MKKHIKKVLVLLLAAVTLMGCMAFNVSAAEVHHSTYHYMNYPANSVTLMSYMHYYYDSNSANAFTKAAAVSDLVCDVNNPITQSYVYLYNCMTGSPRSSTSTWVNKRVSVSLPFYLKDNPHIGESGMMNHPIEFVGSVNRLESQHALYTYEGTHNDQTLWDARSFPASNEQRLYNDSLIITK